MTPWHLPILALATWRLASLLANEQGPWRMFHHIRVLLGADCPEDGGECHSTNTLTVGLLCEWCNSVWFGTLLTVGYRVMGETIIWLVLPLALSTCAIVIKYTVQTMQALLDKLTGG